MKLGIISDTHGMPQAWEKAINWFADADLILHAGDVLYHPPRIGSTPGYDLIGLAELMNTSSIPIIIARGNCDPEVYEEILTMPVLSPYAHVEVNGLRIIINHGHTLDGKRLSQTAEKYRADIFITGHTHIPLIEHCGKCIHINPGSPSHPKFEQDGAPVPTAGIITDNRVQIINIQTGEEILGISLA